MMDGWVMMWNYLWVAPPIFFAEFSTEKLQKFSNFEQEIAENCTIFYFSVLILSKNRCFS